jgi:hypothetical protein
MERWLNSIAPIFPKRSRPARLVDGYDRLMLEIRTADMPEDLSEVRRLWLDYLSWGNDEMESRHGFRLPVHEAVERDVATIEKFQAPDGLLLLASDGAMSSGPRR